jgi:transposase
MFWQRIGTKTPREISGTVEELKNAEKQHKKTGRPQIMLYFKSAAVHPFTCDLKQLEHVRKIRRIVSKKAYYKEFLDEASFAKVFKEDLKQWLQKEILGKPPKVKPWVPAPKKKPRSLSRKTKATVKRKRTRS